MEYFQYQLAGFVLNKSDIYLMELPFINIFGVDLLLWLEPCSNRFIHLIEFYRYRIKKAMFIKGMVKQLWLSPPLFFSFPNS